MQTRSFTSFAWHLYHAGFRSFHSSRYLQKTHYEVLNVARNSSTKEIKAAFIKLSKEFHPDINKNCANTHNEFVKVNEAYSVLSRPDKRWLYDLSLPGEQPASGTAGPSVYDADVQRDPWKDPSFYRNRDRSRDEENRSKPFYGIGRLGRMPNSWLVAVLFAITATGVALQAFAIRHSMTFRRNTLDEASARNSALYSELQEKAQHAGRLNNIRSLHSRLGGTSEEFALLVKDNERTSVEEHSPQQRQQAPPRGKVVSGVTAVDAKSVSIN